MNLVGTLARVAVGMIAARGIGGLLNRGGGGASSGGGLGGLLGGLTGGGSGSQQQSQGGGLGGLGGLLGGLTGGSQGGAQGGGGGLGGLLNSLGGGGAQQAGGAAAGAGAIGGLGGLLNQALGGQSTPEPTVEENSQAEIMLRGMINAAKSDGNIDEQEQAKLMEHLKDASEEEMNFVRNEINQPLDVDGFIRSVPAELAQQVYMMSVLSIKLDSQAEAKYLDRLAKGIGISSEQSNQIHSQLGVPTLYS